MTLTTFDIESASRIAGVVRAVEGEPARTRPLTFDLAAQAASKRVFRVGTFTGAWAHNGTAAVTFINVTTTPNTVAATNLLKGLEGSTAGMNCVIAKEGTSWYYVNSELDRCEQHLRASWLSDSASNSSNTDELYSAGGPQVLVNDNGCVKWLRLTHKDVVIDVVADGEDLKKVTKRVWVFEHTDEQVEGSIIGMDTCAE